jgi:hypothetical protein
MDVADIAGTRPSSAGGNRFTKPDLRLTADIVGSRPASRDMPAHSIVREIVEVGKPTRWTRHTNPLEPARAWQAAHPMRFVISREPSVLFWPADIPSNLKAEKSSLDELRLQHCR